MAVPYCSEGNTDRNAPSQHPISPPQELLQQWWEEAINLQKIPYTEHIAARATQWAWDQREPEIQGAADAELEACIQHLVKGHHYTVLDDLRAARRPKSPSLKEQALAKTTAILNDPSRALLIEVREALELNLRALEALPDD